MDYKTYISLTQVKSLWFYFWTLYIKTFKYKNIKFLIINNYMQIMNNNNNIHTDYMYKIIYSTK